MFPQDKEIRPPYIIPNQSVSSAFCRNVEINLNKRKITQPIFNFEKNYSTFVNYNYVNFGKTYDLNVNRIEPSNSETKTTKKELSKEEIVDGMYDKWSKIFDSPLKKDFYVKLYDVIKVLKCSILDADFKPEIYSSKEEQTMDEVIAIFAGEAQLNPRTQNGKYKGLFQLATPGLTDLKKWAKKHPNFKYMNNIKNITIDKFHCLSGIEQLDYLVAYIGFAKEYSKISKDSSFTPAQIWSMIKYPFEGRIDSSITLSKAEAIQNVFIHSDVKHGLL